MYYQGQSSLEVTHRHKDHSPTAVQVLSTNLGSIREYLASKQKLLAAIFFH